ncbi:unnamed protein product [Adineta ricciae]|uniref:G-protein coupled receptors family 1 profile domain-containing protein n=1 Tax=Adineta ricciae TaxID=249248 RepID=A0A814BM90_ADIRI|nr:unnamed protein product [Adineta ricciae]
MRHATSWQKNQSEDDTFSNRLEISITSQQNKFVRHSQRSTTEYTIFIDTQQVYSLSLVIYFAIFVMRQLSNDTASWVLIDSPLPAPLFYNSNSYDTLPNGAPLINDINHPNIPISNLPTITPQPPNIETNSANYWAFALTVFPIFTIFGNVLVVVSVYREKSLHTITNYFVVSLAISDITVAAVVMPFAIYLEFNRVWELPERLCDFWVASDCMACTASILNLVAIAVDRYIAVTKPLKYARHKNPKRVAIMIVIVWLVSFFIALPIVSGVNKSDIAAYPRVPDQCVFFNNKFLIFSSLGSFFIPGIIIFAIYYRIFMVIMAQARKNRKQWRPKAAIQSAAAQHRSNVNNLVTSYLHDRHDSNHQPALSDSIDAKLFEQASKPATLPNEALPTSKNNGTNTLALNTTGLTPSIRASINVTSSSGDPMDDDERDDIALFVHNEQKRHTKKLDPDNQIEVLPIALSKSNNNFGNSIGVQKTTVDKPDKANHNDTDHHNSSFTTRLKAETNSHGIPATTTQNPVNNAKTAKRKAYSRIKKERKATQTLIVVLSKHCVFAFDSLAGTKTLSK